ncbi:MAG TPA: M56 family metallopeptidase [Candidatus Acidoferrales bacterium]
MIALPIPGLLSSAWTTIGGALANHVWQSTLFAGIAGLLTLMLRQNRAQVRYWLWLLASTKFVLPFSLLVVVGSRLGSSTRLAALQRGFPLVVQQIGHPFVRSSQDHFAATVSAAAFGGVVQCLPVFLLIAWCLGCVLVLFSWWRRWSRVNSIIRAGSSVTAGREFEMLSTLRARCGIPGPVDLVACQSTIEPGIVGMRRPVMVLPVSIAERLSDPQLEAIISHELFHVRRRDNLTAAIHMFVEAIFWFHPLVWWIGGRLVEEREKACDEEVLRLGSDPQAYAEGILKVCEFYLESRLFCAAGVTGSNLKKRMEAIMTHRASDNLPIGKRILLTVVAAVAVLGPVVIGLLNPVASRAQSESSSGASSAAVSVSIKPSVIPTANTIRVRRTEHSDAPSEFQATGIALTQLVALAYDVNNFQVSGGPDWAASTRYDVEATAAANQDVMPAVQAALAERFRLAVHHETKDDPAYELVVANSGSKLKQVPAADASPRNSQMMFGPPGHLAAVQITMSALARVLSMQTGRMVVDKTGLTGSYDFTLDWQVPMPNPERMAKMEFTPSPESIASLVTAVPQQLGLQLNDQTAPVDTIVIDYAEPLAGNQ